MALVDEFAARLVGLAAADLPDDVVHETRRCLLNVLGTAIGASPADEVDALVEVGVLVGGGEVVVPGRTEALDRLWAASVIGFAAHFDDYDDTHLETVIHPGAATLGALYPLALSLGSPKDRCLSAMALGVEAQLRVGLAMTPSHYDLGWHITGTCGVVGAAVAAGVLLGSTAETMKNAIGIAANMTLGQREAFGTPVKPYHAGKAASNGLLAALLADRGVVTPPSVLTGTRGYFEVLADDWDPAWLAPADLGERWVLLDNTYKPFPCGIVAHPAIEAAVVLHDRLGRRQADDVERVAVACNPLVVELMGRREVATGLEARFCAVHGVAVGLLTGAGGLTEFSDKMATDPRVASLRDRTFLEPDDTHGRQAATVVVHFTDGTSIEHDVVAASGSLEHPLTDEQLLEKFSALVEPILPRRSSWIANAVMELGTSTSISEIDKVVAGT